MIVSDPMPFAEALESRAVRTSLPTSLSSARLREIDRELLVRSNFSARTFNVEYLDDVNRVINQLVDGEIDQATGRMALKSTMERLGGPEAVGEQGVGLRDLGSDARLNLILETNTEMAQGYGHYVQGQDTAILDQWPAQELIRVIEPQGTPRDWPERWEAVGGEFYDGRMIARKDSDIWQRLGSDFADGLQNPYPPFAFNSGMDVQDIRRSEAEQLGVLTADATVRPAPDKGFNDELRFSKPIRAQFLRDALESSDEQLYFDDAGVLRTRGRAAA